MIILLEKKEVVMALAKRVAVRLGVVEYTVVVGGIRVAALVWGPAIVPITKDKHVWRGALTRTSGSQPAFSSPPVLRALAEAQSEHLWFSYFLSGPMPPPRHTRHHC